MKKIALFALGIAIIVFILGVAFGPVLVFAQTADASEEAKIKELQGIVVQLLKIVADLQRQLLAVRQAQAIGAPLCGQAEITWAKVSGAADYVLYRMGVEVYSGKNLRFTDTGLMPGATYAYTIRARNAGGLGPASPVQTITVASQCAPPAPIVWGQAGVCGGNAQIFWSRAQRADFYEVFRGNTRVFSSNTISFLDRGLSMGKSYTYKVRAGNTGGLGVFSQETSVKASVVCPPGAPLAPTIAGPLFGSAAKEALFTVAIQKSPSGATAQSGESGVNVLAFKASADLSSVVIGRVDVQFSDRPWLFLSSVEIRDGSRTVSKIDVAESSFVKTEDHTYLLRFTSLAIAVPKDKSKTISVRVVAKDNLFVDPPKQLTVSIPANGVRARDEAGFFHQGPGVQEAAIFVKTFFVKKKVVKP
ncbi:MAG TPA: fibronectin type III domain-containing protein [Candidatus Paceibacterota bacterium]